MDRCSLAPIGFLVMAFCPPAWSQATHASEPQVASPPPSTQPEGAFPGPASASVPGQKLPGPAYAPVRQDDDFSYLDGPEGSYVKDLWDPLKRIRLGEDVVLRLGGEARGRMEAVTHKRYGVGERRRGNAPPTQDTFFLHRYYYHLDVQYRKLFRVFFEGVSAFAEDVDQTPMPPPRDRWDIHQLFADLRVLGEDIPLALRFGRQELLYGKERLVSPLDWANVRRAWDGAKLFWAHPLIDIDVWYVRPVEVRHYRPDEYDEDIHFYGLYSTYKGIKNHGIDAYFLALRNEGRYTNANYRTGDIGDLSVYTLGTRFWGRTPVGAHMWDYDTEWAGQWGKASGDTIQAWMWAAQTGYSLLNWPWKPRLGIGLDWASGDDDPFDDIHGTFNQLFPLGHAWLGYLDQIARQNIWAQNVNLTLKPHEQVTTQLAFHTFWLDKNQDALYNASGVPVRRNVRGGVGDLIGNELDITVTWELDAHASLLFGYSHLWTSSHFFTRASGDAEDPDLFYVQYRYRF